MFANIKSLCGTHETNIILYVNYEREREVTQSCPTLCNHMDCSLPGSSVHGIFQAIVLEWIAISFSKGSSQPRDTNPGLPHCRQALYRLSHQGSLHIPPKKGWNGHIFSHFVFFNSSPLLWQSFLNLLHANFEKLSFLKNVYNSSHPYSPGPQH